MKVRPSQFHFSGGIHPDAHDSGKMLTRDRAIVTQPTPSELVLSMSQHLGAPATCCVKVGDFVRAGEVIGTRTGFISLSVRASASGQVKAIESRLTASGVRAQAVILDTTVPSPTGDTTPVTLPPLDGQSASREELLTRIEEAGICGMGGAGFPTCVKLNPPPGKRCDYLILNGAECEPYLTADDRVMREEAQRIRVGTEIMRRILGGCAVRLAVEENKPEAIRALSDAFADISGDVELVILPVLYPQGSEKHQIYATVGRTVPEPPALPIDVGCVVENVGTVVALADAVEKGLPLLSRVTTVSGEALTTPQNVRAPLGTKYADLIAFCGGTQGDVGKVISGGPMMGFTVSNLEIPTTKTTSGLLLFPKHKTFHYTSGACINCGRCLRACPMHLSCSEISRAVESDAIHLAEELHVMSCLACGACSFVCPAMRPITQLCRKAQASIRARRAAEKIKAQAGHPKAH